MGATEKAVDRFRKALDSQTALTGVLRDAEAALRGFCDASWRTMPSDGLSSISVGFNIYGNVEVAKSEGPRIGVTIDQARFVRDWLNTNL